MKPLFFQLPQGGAAEPSTCAHFRFLCRLSRPEATERYVRAMLNQSPTARWPGSAGFGYECYPIFGRHHLHPRNVAIEEGLADRVALVVMTAAGKSKEFGFEIGQPRRSLGQKRLPRLEFRRRNSHA